MGGLSAPDPNNLGIQELEGTIITTDVVKVEQIEKILKASQNRTELDLEWTHSDNQLKHFFTVKGIKRLAEAQKVELNFNGAPIGLSKKESKEVEIPALGDFKVTEVKAVPGQQAYISLYFSDPLQKTQNLEGLITISDYEGTFRYEIEGNTIMLYPNARLVGG